MDLMQMETGNILYMATLSKMLFWAKWAIKGVCTENPFTFAVCVYFAS